MKSTAMVGAGDERHCGIRDDIADVAEQRTPAVTHYRGIVHPERSTIVDRREIFSHPDYTVGFGISPNLPNEAQQRLHGVGLAGFPAVRPGSPPVRTSRASPASLRAAVLRRGHLAPKIMFNTYGSNVGSEQWFRKRLSIGP